jgi:hypothetical protein
MRKFVKKRLYVSLPLITSHGRLLHDTIFPQEFIIDYIKVYKTPTQ